MKHQTSKTLFSYWNEVRGTRPAPRRFEIEPARLSSILPEAFILERVDAATYRFRLAGTKLCEQFGMEFRGSNFLDSWDDADRVTLSRGLAKVAEKGAVSQFEVEAQGVSGRSVQFEVLIVPLSQSNTVIDRFLGTMSTTDDASWLGSEPLRDRYLLRHELLWPSGGEAPKMAQPHVTGYSTDLFKPVMQPKMRDARLVRVERRNFRVYEGGLSRLYQEKD